MIRPVLGLAFLAALLLHPTRSQADPANHGNVPPNWLADTISTDRTITFAEPGPTYFVYGDVTVLPSVTLTIEPGVTLTFAGDADFMVSGSHTNRAELLVGGTLAALAQGGAPIRFESNGGSQWGGVTISAGGAGHFRNVTLASVTTALRAFGPCDMDSSTISDASSAIQASANVTIGHTVIGGGGAAQGIYVFGSGSLLMTDSNITITGSMAPAIQANGASLTIANSTLQALYSVIWVTGAAPLTLTDVVLTSLTCSIFGTLEAPDAGPVDLRRVTITGAYGANLTAANGTARSLAIIKSPSCSGATVGIGLGSGIQFPVDDSTSVSPSSISDFNSGAEVTSSPVRFRNVLFSGLQYAVHANNQTVELNYCTIASSVTGVYFAGAGSAIYNSIISATTAFDKGTSQCRAVAYSDLWALNTEPSWPWCNGGQVASFDPGFVGTGPLPYKLLPTSLFTDFSVSGREIGAYGPGPGPPPASVGEDVREARTLSISPNPSVDGRLAISFDAPDGGNVMVEVLDVAGRRVWLEQFADLPRGTHAAAVGTRLAKGVYWLRVTSGTSRQGRRFVVLG